MTDNVARCQRCNGRLWFDRDRDLWTISCLDCGETTDRLDPDVAKRQAAEMAAAMTPDPDFRGRGRPRKGEERATLALPPSAERNAAWRQARDQEIVRLAGLGLGNPAIAARLSLTHETVSNLRNKLGCGSHPQRANRKAKRRVEALQSA